MITEGPVATAWAVAGCSSTSAHRPGCVRPRRSPERDTPPTLVIGGERDNVYSPDIFRRTAEGVPHGRLVLYLGAGHGATFTHRRFAADVTEFLLSS
ncbi:MAG: alpha/beta fold hydrolase [Actinomycetes bacterium]